ncbi:MAG: sugar phosphate nucleotidyltransferase, partial [Candidatus Nanohaloarchaea archaeon]
VVVEDHESEEGKIGSLGAIIQVIDEYGADDYLVVGGDNYTELDLARFVDAAQAHGAPTIACYEVDDRADASAFGVVDVDDDGRITGFVEKPEEPPSNLVSTLFYYFPEEAMDMLDAYVDAHEDSDADYLDEPGRLIEWAYTRQDWYAHGFSGSWYDIGTPANYLKAQAALADRRVDGKVTDSDLGENVWIMDGAEVSNSDLEDCIVFPDADISDARLQGTIV